VLSFRISQGALFATVTVTSLQTPVLDNIHWTVTAAWTSTLVIASFSVFTSYNVYKALAGLTTAENLKRFYSGLSPDILKYRDYIERMDKEALNNVEDFGPYFVAQWIDIPRLFMYLTIMGYLLGLGLLWLLQWKGPYDAQGLTTRETSRNVRMGLSSHGPMQYGNRILTDQLTGLCCLYLCSGCMHVIHHLLCSHSHSQ
jgi:hypothetical protein